LLHEAQLEELHPAQPPLPATGTGAPDSPVVKQANRESTRSDLPLQSGHTAGSADLLKGRISSNLLRHFLHTYS
jgi:hypothetical protein